MGTRLPRRAHTDSQLTVQFVTTRLRRTMASKIWKDRRDGLGLAYALVTAGSFFSCTDDGRSAGAHASGGSGPSEEELPSSGGSPWDAATSGGSNGYGGRGGEAGGNRCSVELLDFPAPTPPDLVRDSGQVLVSPVLEDGQASCPEGTVPSERVQCLDAPICACEYPCSPRCADSEVCVQASDGNVCVCHSAMDGEAGDRKSVV